MPAVEFAQLLSIPLPVSCPYQTFTGLLLQEFDTIPNVGTKLLAVRDCGYGWAAN
jgi:hypothetical protein